MIRSCAVLLVMAVLGAVPGAAGWDEGVAALRGGALEAARDHFEALIELEPRGWRGHYLLGLSLEALDRKPEALTEFKRAGVILAELATTVVGRADTAEVILERELFDVVSGRRAAELAGPGPHWQPLVYLGISLAVDGDCEKAILELQAASKKANQPSPQKIIWRQLANCFEQLERYGEAAEAYRKAHDPQGAARMVALINAM